MSFVIVSACTAILLVFTSIFETLIRVLHTPFIADARDYDRELGMRTWVLGFSMDLYRRLCTLGRSKDPLRLVP
jgi:hypothetical protein